MLVEGDRERRGGIVGEIGVYLGGTQGREEGKGVGVGVELLPKTGNSMFIPNV